MAGDELVDQVEVGLGDAVELDHAAVGDPQRRLGVVRPGHRDQPEGRVLGDEGVTADGTVGEELRAQRPSHAAIVAPAVRCRNADRRRSPRRRPPSRRRGRRAARRRWEPEARFPRDAALAAAADGLLGLFAPKGVGGQGLTFAQGMAVFEELGRGDAAYAFALSMHNAVAAAIGRFGSAGVKRRHGRRLTSGQGARRVLADRAARRLRRRRHQGAPEARRRRLPALRHQGLGLAVRRGGRVPGGVPDGRPPRHEGRRDGRPRRVPARASSRAPVRHDDLGVPAGRRDVGCATCGSRRTRCWRRPAPASRPRSAPSTWPAPTSRRSRSAWPRRRSTRRCLHARPRHLRRHGARPAGIQFALADVETDIVAGRLLYERAAELLGTPEGAVAAAHAKRFNPDMALQAAIECAEALGSYGWLKTAPTCRGGSGWRGCCRRSTARARSSGS